MRFFLWKMHRINRPRVIACVVCVGGFLTSSTLPAFGQRVDRTEVDSRNLITPATTRAIDSGLKLLASRQSADGSFGAFGPYRKNVGVAGLAGMAFMAGGHSPGRGEYGPQLSRLVTFLLNNARPDGFIQSPDRNATHGPMYGHGFATLFLAEAYGMSPRNKELRRTLKAAVQLIIRSQNEDGGWRYQPRPFEADISVTVCQVMALRAARNAGIAVPKETVDNCTKYVKRCQNADGGFRYQIATRPESEFPRSAAAVVALYSAGIYDGQEIERGINYVSAFRPGLRASRYSTHYYFYGQYYAAQVMWHAGGAHWSRWYPAIRDELLQRQGRNGAWSDRNVSDAFATAVACLVLQMPNNYLPIFQR